MTVHLWSELDRATLSGILPEAIVVLPLGAVEQHGPHLPAGTDFILASSIARRAAEATAHQCRRDLVIAPLMAIGASDHHIAFGGTVSLSASTMLSVVTDILTSIGAAGASRIVIVNGHGGNSGPVRTAAAAVSAHQTSLSIAHVDYWRVLPTASDHVPGHAGLFETSLMLAIRPELVLGRGTRNSPPQYLTLRGAEIYSAAEWSRIDGFTDNPGDATAEPGRVLLDQIVAELADLLRKLGAAW